MKITKQGTKTIKTLILLIVATLIATQVLPSEILIFIYPALMLGLIFLLPVFHKYRKTADFSFFGNLCFAAILTLAFLLLLPLVISVGPIAFALLSLVYIILGMAAERVMESDIDATLMTIIFLVIMLLLNGLNTLALTAPAFLAAAVILDLTRTRFPMWVRGMFAGLIWSSIIFGFSNHDLYEASTVVVYSTAAGLVAASIFAIFHLDDEKHIERLLKKW